MIRQLFNPKNIRSVSRVFYKPIRGNAYFGMQTGLVRFYSTTPEKTQVKEFKGLSETLKSDRVEPNRSNYGMKPKSPLYHRGSTLYTYTKREDLVALDIDVNPRLYKATTFSDQIARGSVWALRKLSNMFFRDKGVKYCVLLETVAAVPGLVAAALLHLRALRTMEQNNWIKTLMDESENERMHLMTFVELTKPTLLERAFVAAAQAVYWNMFLVFYVLSPKTAHRFTGYLEEEAVNTYNHFLKDIDAGKIENVPAPKIAKDYWGLPEDATLRDVVLVIRADEMNHRDVNHALSTKISKGDSSPVE